MNTTEKVTDASEKLSLRRPRAVDYLTDERYPLSESLEEFLSPEYNTDGDRTSDQYHALSTQTIRTCIDNGLFPWNFDEYHSVFLSQENLRKFQEATELYDRTYGLAIQEGKDRAKKVRSHWLHMITSGSVEFPVVVEMSKRDDEHKYIGKISLLEILKNRPGWTETSALNFLVDVGIGPTDNILSIRRSSRLVKQFAAMLESAPDRWRQRPQLPKGWPWNGKLSDLIVITGARMPPELDQEEVNSGASEADEVPELELSSSQDSDQKDLSLNFLD